MNKKRETKKQYSIYKCRISEKEPLFKVFNEWSHLSNNLYNETLFIIRQLFTGLNKDKKDMNVLEITTIDNVLKILKTYNKKLILDKNHRLVNFYFMDYYFKKTNNKNYNSFLPKQSAQHVIKDACNDFKNWLKALKSYKKSPSKFMGKPKMPKYRKSGDVYTVKLTNQDVILYKKKFSCEVKFPKTKYRLNFTNKIKDKKLKEVNIKYEYDTYKITYIFEDKIKPITNTSNVMCGIDLGVNNIAAIQTNNGNSLLVKGKFIKSKNQWFNKKIAKNMYGQTIGTTKKAISSKTLNKLYKKRKLFMEDVMHKISKKIINWCINKNVSTIVIGSNKFWKQNINIGKANNQTFTQIPFSLLIKYIEDKALKSGIKVIKTEESYTSKASFLDLDNIPVYDKNKKYTFSGKRISRGMYKASNGFCFNADLNGAGNILRKYLNKNIIFNLKNLKSPEVLNVKDIYK